MAAYFNEPDHSGHKEGPNSTLVNGYTCTCTKGQILKVKYVHFDISQLKRTNNLFTNTIFI